MGTSISRGEKKVFCSRHGEAPCVSIPETVEAILSSAGIHAETSCHSHHRQMREHAVHIHKKGK